MRRSGTPQDGEPTQIAGKDVDCPLFQFDGPTGKLPGCIGVKVTLGNDTQFKADDKNHQPRACCFPDGADQGWNVAFSRSSNAIAGTCSTTPFPDKPQFCSSVVACDN